MSDMNVSLSGGIYSHPSAVTDADANKIADYEGDAGCNFTSTHVEWRGQSLFIQDSVMIEFGVTINIARMLLVDDTLETLWGITGCSGTFTKEAAPAQATVYEFTTTYTALPTNEFLVSTTRSSDSKKFQIWLAAGKVAGEFPFSFTQSDYIVHDISIIGYPDADDKIVTFIKEI